MKIKFSFISFVLSLGTITLLIFSYLSNRSTAYVDVQFLYDNFEYKIELEKNLVSLSNKRSYKLDSLKLEINMLAQNLNSEIQNGDEDVKKFNIRRENYLQLKNHFEKEYTDLVRAYDDQIYSQITQYVLDYGEQSGYSYIFGATGAGNIMYAGDNENISEDVLNYINRRFKGDAK